jgi:hypothetical protein
MFAGMWGSKPSGSIDVCVVCCTVRPKEEARAIKSKKQVRTKYKDRTRKRIQKEKK